VDDDVASIICQALPRHRPRPRAPGRPVTILIGRCLHGDLPHVLGGFILSLLAAADVELRGVSLGDATFRRAVPILFSNST